MYPVGFLQYLLKICTQVLLVTVSVFLSLNFFSSLVISHCDLLCFVIFRSFL